jgi:hypothetical protein
MDLIYTGVHLSAVAGSDNKIYLVSRIITGDYPRGHILLFTVDIMSGQVTVIEDLTPGQTRACMFPYISVKPREHGNDLIAVAYEINNLDARAVFISNHSGAWSNPMVLNAGDESSGHPCVAINGGFADLVYESPNNSDNTQIYHQRYEFSTGTLYGATQVTDSDIYFNQRPVIATDSYGNLHLIYITNRENPDIFGDEEVYYSVFDAPPRSPERVRFNRNAGRISWDNNPEPDISHYEVELNGELLPVSGSSVDVDLSAFNEIIIAIRAQDLSGQQSHPAIYRSTKRGLREMATIPKRLFVGNNYPNPFNSSTWIPYSAINISSPLYLEIIDIKGRVVKTVKIYNENMGEVFWDGTNDSGYPVSSGTYLYRLRSRWQVGNNKFMTLLK